MLTNTISFDVHVLQLYLPLMFGGCLVIAKPDGHTDGAYICQLMRQHAITVSLPCMERCACMH